MNNNLIRRRLFYTFNSTKWEGEELLYWRVWYVSTKSEKFTWCVPNCYFHLILVLFHEFFNFIEPCRIVNLQLETNLHEPSMKYGGDWRSKDQLLLINVIVYDFYSVQLLQLSHWYRSSDRHVFQLCKYLPRQSWAVFNKNIRDPLH